MMQLHINVSLVEPNLQSILPSLATPGHIASLLRLLGILPPQEKLKIIKILDGLRQHNLPIQIFDAAVDQLGQGNDAEQDDSVFCKHLQSNFSKFIYRIAAKIRSFEGLNKHLEGD